MTPMDTAQGSLSHIAWERSGFGPACGTDYCACFQSVTHQPSQAEVCATRLAALSEVVCGEEGA